MADREKVINCIEICCSARPKCAKCDFFDEEDCNSKLMHDALELLKEQEPKLVVATTNSYGTKFYHCPRCNHDLYAYPRQKYCGQCGQAVKWDG